MAAIFDHPGMNQRIRVTAKPGMPIPLAKKSFTASFRLPARTRSLICRLKSTGSGGCVLSTMNGGSYMDTFLTLGLSLSSGLQSEDRSRRTAEQEGGTPRGVDQGLDVFHFSFNGIRLRVGTPASSAAIVIHDSEVPGKMIR